jgi:hypothetical protein
MPAWGDAFQMTSENKDQARKMMSDLANYLWTLQAK